MEAVSVENPLMTRVLATAPTGIFINGAQREARDGEWFGVINPATGNVIARATDVGAGGGLAALETTAAAQDGWARAVSRARAELLRSPFEIAVERTEKFTALTAIGMGKSLAEARGEVVYGTELLHWFSEEAVRLNGRYSTTPEGNLGVITMPRPVGPVPAITPWNPPSTMITRKLGSALAAGCTDIPEPSKPTLLTTPAFVEACQLAGVPSGMINVIPTSSPAALAGSLLRDSRLWELSFTGSTDVGKGLLCEATDNVLWTSMELGGYALSVIFGDADPDHAVAVVGSARLRNMGGTCNAANRFYVSRELADGFAVRLAAEFEGLVVGDGLDPNTNIGPIITSGQRQHIRGLVEEVREHSAKVLAGSEDVAGSGYFYRPTVLTATDPGEPVICKELFGLVAPVMSFDSEEQVLVWASSLPVGLATYVRTEDIDRALRMTERLEVGMTGINSAAISNPAAPLGGAKHSGLDREGGSEDITEYLEAIHVGIPA